MTRDARAAGAPPGPGVYIMRDAAGEVIYIGKAKNLKSRVSSYFVGSHDAKTASLVEKVASIEYVLQDKESEAFLLESNLIKRHRPRYNIELKDQQRYTYLRITDEKYPRLVVARRTRGGGFMGAGRVYGPFTRGSSKVLTIGSLRKAFKVRICKTLPKRACLEYHLGNCDAPCEFESAAREYAGNIADLKSVLRGGTAAREFTSRLKAEMDEASAALQFERAMGIRDTLWRLGALHEGQSVERPEGTPDEDYVAIRRDEAGGVALVMTMRGVRGVIRDTERFEFDLVADNTLANFVYQYYTTRVTPRYVVASEAPGGTASLEAALSSACGHDVSIVVPRGGKRLKVIGMLLRSLDVVRAARAAPGMAELRDALGLARAPRAIECFDISNHGEDYAVGAMSRLVDGEPDRGGYRNFRIRTVSGRDDYAMIAEVVKRRYSRLADEGGPMPDLVLIDGGRGQLRAAIGALEDAGVEVACASIAKRDEEVFVPGRAAPVRLDRRGAALQALQRARDEAHRIGVRHNRRLRAPRGERRARA